MNGPMSITDLFSNNDDSDCDLAEYVENLDSKFLQNYEIQLLKFNENINLNIRQFSWHQTNANQVWPGAFRLANHITDHSEKYVGCKILELGAATGALAIFLNMLNNTSPQKYDIITSDIDDGGIVENNIEFNCNLNSKWILYTCNL
jgi:predicted nicotinamide N-methyase